GRRPRPHAARRPARALSPLRNLGRAARRPGVDSGRMLDPPTPPPPQRGYAIASLILGILSLPTAGLLLLGAMVRVVLGVVALVKASREPGRYAGKGMAVAGIVLSGLSILVLPVIGIVA